MDTRHTLSRRRALVTLGAGGLGAALAAGTTIAQEGTPVVVPEGTPVTAPAGLEEWVAGWEAADAERLASVYAEDAVVEVVPFGTTLHGREAIREYFTAYFGAFDAPDARIVTVISGDDQAAAEWTFHGQYTGQLPGLPAGDGQPVSLRGVNIMELSDGEIAVERIYTDLAGLLGQLGVEGVVPGTPPVATPAG